MAVRLSCFQARMGESDDRRPLRQCFSPAQSIVHTVIGLPLEKWPMLALLKNLTEEVFYLFD